MSCLLQFANEGVAGLRQGYCRRFHMQSFPAGWTIEQRTRVPAGCPGRVSYMKYTLFFHSHESGKPTLWRMMVIVHGGSLSTAMIISGSVTILNFS